jgi:hypothetical protein
VIDAYRDWITANVEGDGYGKCAEATQAMAAAFPELRRVRGHYYCSVWGERSHWWLVAEDGSIVDPTAGQFPSIGLGGYVEWHEGDDEPTGKCANCGGYVYNSATVCSSACHQAMVDYLTTGVR